KDGHLVVIHDVKLGRTTNGEGRVREKTLAELKALSAGAWWSEKYAKERIPTLEELIPKLDNPAISVFTGLLLTTPAYLNH
ncbi:MAG: glycerophosphodiester phosphodiesterase, partial [Candidatus Aerophobus sp.]